MRHSFCCRLVHLKFLTLRLRVFSFHCNFVLNVLNRLPDSVTMDYNAMDEQQKRVIIADSQKISDHCRREVVELEEKKRRVSREIQEKKAKLRQSKPSNPDILSGLSLRGYVLSDFNHEKLDELSHKYTACCDDKVHPFKIFVILKCGRVSKTGFSLPAYSALQEIQSYLHMLCEESCPYLLLSAIQQFIHLYNFRNKVARQLRSKGDILVYIPQFPLNNREGVCNIVARNGRNRDIVFQLSWTMIWDQARELIVHNFTASEEQIGMWNPGVKPLLDRLINILYSSQYEHKILQAWDEICKWMGKE